MNAVFPIHNTKILTFIYKFQYKDGLSIYVDLHYKYKTVMKPAYLYNGNPYTGKKTSLYWDNPQTTRIWRQWHLHDCKRQLWLNTTCLSFLKQNVLFEIPQTCELFYLYFWRQLTML